MKLIINNKNIEFKNDISEVKPLLTVIIQALAKDSLELSHLLVDGVPVYQDFEHYLCDKIATVNEIEVITLELKALISDTLMSTLDYITNAVSLLKPLSENFYQSPDQAVWSQLADLFEGISWLLDSMNRIDQIDQLPSYLTNYDIWNEYVQTMKQLNIQLRDLGEAMINKDHVLIGDLILYEVLPIFEVAEEKLRFFVPAGGHHVS